MQRIKIECIILLFACIVFISAANVLRANSVQEAEDINLMYLDQPAPCKCTGGKCVTVNGKEVCKCPPEYGIVDDKSCKACQCGEGSNCTFTCNGMLCFSTTKKCICKEGYKEISGKCYGPCTNSPCKNGGTCTDVKGGYKCICPPKYTGSTCGIRADPCSINPCQNGGACKVEGKSYKCECMLPFSGKNCEIDPCSINPCQNGGACKVEGKSYKCECMLPFSGKTVKLVQKSLFNKSMSKWRSMQGGGKSYKCECMLPFSGKNCEIGTKNPCSINPCQNGGACKVEGKSYKCECMLPFSGKNCEIEKPQTMSTTTSTTPTKDVSTSLNTTSQTATYTNLIFNETTPTDFISTQINVTSHEPSNATQDFNETTPDFIPVTTFEPSNFTNEFTNFTDFHSTSYELVNFTNGNKVTTFKPYNFTKTFSSSISTLNLSTREEPSTMPITKQPASCTRYGDCLNEGICKRTEGHESFCECLPHFGGTICEVYLPCASLDQSCRAKGAVCKVVEMGAVCECPPDKAFHHKSGMCENICDSKKCVHGKCEIDGRNYICNCDEGYIGTFCDKVLKKEHEYFVPWFIAIAFSNLAMCLLLIGVICLICQKQRFIKTQ
ncbi:hypothetical protein CDAR_588872 [Caerostris darwini]|uniref:EGF-like domain-containing protein n=1 Tax=Caerostris darwini TaxID=1538125 RepID=A0AAV4R461_9ARAC|nr:hypothetical protein CDAR_588872 [Caerostris darwini]